MKTSSTLLVTLLGPLLGGFMFYYGLLGNYVVLSMDGAALVIVSVVYALTPRQRLPEPAVLNALLTDTLLFRETLDKTENRSVVFDKESVYVFLSNGKKLSFELSQCELGKLCNTLKSSDSEFRATHTFSQFLTRQGLVSEVLVKNGKNDVLLKVKEPLLLTKVSQPCDVALSPLLCVLCSCVSKDLGKSVSVIHVQNDEDELIVKLGEANEN